METKGSSLTIPLVVGSLCTSKKIEPSFAKNENINIASNENIVKQPISIAFQNKFQRQTERTLPKVHAVFSI